MEKKFAALKLALEKLAEDQNDVVKPTLKDRLKAIGMGTLAGAGTGLLSGTGLGYISNKIDGNIDRYNRLANSYNANLRYGYKRKMFNTIKNKLLEQKNNIDIAGPTLATVLPVVTGLSVYHKTLKNILDKHQKQKDTERNIS